MTSLTLELSNLSLANLRVMEPFLAPAGLGVGEMHEPSQISFPKHGFKTLLAGTSTNKFVTYIYIFAQNQVVDWLYRLNGKDHYGATFSMFRGSICNEGENCTEAKAKTAQKLFGTILVKCSLPVRRFSYCAGRKEERATFSNTIPRSVEYIWSSAAQKH